MSYKDGKKNQIKGLQANFLIFIEEVPSWLTVIKGSYVRRAKGS